ncbi:hypothetical protein BGZ46_004224 [Entomortierella lignicola]|nr:hypothetical protein BGZ46_004224 [Entomortierella lignicola]
MTPRREIHLGELHPVHLTNPQLSNSDETFSSQSSVVDNYFNDSEDYSDDEEQQNNGEYNRHFCQNAYNPNTSGTTLAISLANLSNTSIPNGDDYGTDSRYPGHDLLSPNVTRVSSMLRSHGDGTNKSKKSSAVGIDHALKLGFLSTLGPGIPVTPTASVFGDGLNGFITNNPSYPGGLFGYSPVEEERLVRKIDWRIIPILGMFYALSTLNRVNLINARLYAFESTLRISAEQYSWVVALFYVGYGIAEIPSNLTLLYLTPRVWLPASMFIWGCITFCLAWAKGFHLLLVDRFCLGLAEAALVPGVLVYISMFYKRSEQTFRMAILQAFSSAAGALGGLLARVIAHLDGRLDLLGWQWIFIVESIMTIILSVAAWFLLTESPESAPWLNQRETSIAIYRIRNDTKIKVTKRISRQNIIAAIKDRKVYFFMAINMCIAISMVSSAGVDSRAWMALAKTRDLHTNPVHSPINHTTHFPINHTTHFPTNNIVHFPIKDQTIPINTTTHTTTPVTGRHSGHHRARALHEHLKGGTRPVVQEPSRDARMLAQLLSTPTYIVGAISSFCVALIADRTQQRGIILMILALVMIVGYLMQLLILNPYINYAGVMVLSIGQTPMTPVVSSWLTTNFGGYAKRVIAVAMFLLSSSIGSIIGSQLYKAHDGPRYTISLAAFVICAAALQRFLLKRENNRRNYSVGFGINPLKSFTKVELRDLSDKHPAFRYTL